jgi:hypothetical protein
MIHGFIGKPEFAKKKNRGEKQFLSLSMIDL